jgi:hypothetical protein
MAVENQTVEQLKQSIAELKKNMHHALDTKERTLLSDMLESIGGGERDPAPEVLDETDELREQLGEQAVQFESRHPKLAGAIREVMDVLAKMGI